MLPFCTSTSTSKVFSSTVSNTTVTLPSAVASIRLFSWLLLSRTFRGSSYSPAPFTDEKSGYTIMSPAFSTAARSPPSPFSVTFTLASGLFTMSSPSLA